MGKLLFAVALAVFTVFAAASDSVTPARAVFAGGCFWCMEPPYDEIDGVLETISGYAGGHVENPTYKQVTTGRTGHLEVVEVVYDPAKVSYSELLAVYWVNIDPLDDRGQFCDKGSSYRAAIFTSTPEEQQVALASKAAVEKRLGQPVVTRILAFEAFYPAEDYHQNYYQVNPLRYKYYRYGCRRDQRLNELWGGE